MKFSMKKVTVLLADGFEEIEALIGSRSASKSKSVCGYSINYR